LRTRRPTRSLPWRIARGVDPTPPSTLLVSQGGAHQRRPSIRGDGAAPFVGVTDRLSHEAQRPPGPRENLPRRTAFRRPAQRRSVPTWRVMTVHE